MDIVDLNTVQRSGDDALSGGDAGWADRARRITRSVTPAQLSAALLIVGFVLVMASQLLPWVRVTHQPHNNDFGGSLAKTIGMMDSDGVLQIPYYMLWLVVFASGGALVFADGARRRVAFGAATGALASQLLIVLPILHRPVDLINESLGYRLPAIRLVHASGSYCVIAAFVVLAAALVVAVSGRVFPSSVAPPAASGVNSTGTMYDALAESVPGQADRADIQIGWSSNRAEVGSVELTEPETPAPVARDHSMYQRPTRSEEAKI